MNYCCKRFQESVEEDEVIDQSTDLPDETDWHIIGGGHIFYCPFCGKDIKGEGHENFDGNKPSSH